MFMCDLFHGNFQKENNIKKKSHNLYRLTSAAKNVTNNKNVLTTIENFNVQNYAKINIEQLQNLCTKLC
jgi:hypothetical protein